MNPNLQKALILAGVVAGVWAAHKYGNDMVRGLATVVGGVIAAKQLPVINQLAA